MDALCDLKGHNNIVDAIMAEMKFVFDKYASAQRILSYYADLPQIFFTLARRRAGEAIDAMLKCYGADAINVTDSDGETALDFALEYDPAAAGMLRKYGATVRGIYRAGSRKMREMLMMGSINFSEEVYNYFLDAVGSGFLDVNAMIDFGPEGLKSAASLHEEDERNECVTTTTICHRYKTNVFLEAILLDTTGELVKKCLECGADVNIPIKFSRDKKTDWECDSDGCPVFFKGFRDAEVIMRTPLDLSDISCINVVKKLLKKAGAKNYFQIRNDRCAKIVKVD